MTVFQIAIPDFKISGVFGRGLLEIASGVRLIGTSCATVVGLLAPTIFAGLIVITLSSAAVAQQPVSLLYTDTSKVPETADDIYWNRYFSADLEVVLHQPSFVAHFSVGRLDSKTTNHGLGILYLPRLCEDIAPGHPTVAHCPGILTTYREGIAPPERIQLETPICLVHDGDRPPSASDASINDAMITPKRENSEPFLILSAVLHGEPVDGCTVKNPLGHP